MRGDLIRIAGIDGCKRGWVAVHSKADELWSAQVSYVVDLRDFFSALNIEFAVVDIPIGFTSGPTDRDVESAMRAMLKGKSSSVFNTPCRQALFEESYQAASVANRQTLGKGMSKQTHAIFPKMREMDQIVRGLGQDRIREGHPEVTFAVMKGAPVLSQKKDSAGQAARASLLRANGIDAENIVSGKRSLGAARDDILDAAAMLWTAKRFLERRHIIIPSQPSRDSVGLEMSVIA